MTKGKCPVCKLIGLLLVVGAVNWGVIGAIGKNPIHKLLGGIPHAERAAYILVGLAGIVALLSCVKGCPCSCKKEA